MKKLLLFLFLSISYSTFAQTITLNFPAGSQCQQNIQLSYDPSNNVTDGGATWYTYKINEGSIKYNPNQTRWELLDGSTTIAYCLNETAPKPPASGWTDASNICGAPTLSGDVSVISLSPSTLPNATSGTAYSQTITASGGTGPYSFEVISGSLPASLTLSNGGVLSGTPTVAGTYNFRIKATDASSEYSHQAYTLIVTSPEINIQGNSATIADGDNTPSTTDHTDFGSTPVASGSLVRTFTIQNTGAGSLSISSVVVSGANAADFSVTAQPSTTVAASGFTTFEVTFNPSAGGVRNATVTVNSNDADEAVYDFAITGVGTDLIVSTTKSNVSCNGGANGSATVSTSGATGTVTYSWSPSGGNAATENGLAAGTYTVTVTDDNETETVNVTITQPDELVLPYAIPRGTLGEAYSASVVASGGISPYSYHLSGGALPSGLTLSTSGNITGTPSSAGAFYPTISVTDANGCLKWVNYNFVINKRDQSISFPAIASGIIYGDSPITLNASASSGLTVSYASSNPAVATISGQTLTIVGAGTADITASQPGDDNWNPAADKTQTITIGKKQLNVTADVKGKVYGATDPALTVSYSGFANGDDKDDLGGTLAISRASGENVGAYPIMPSGQTSGNYDIYYTGNSLIINKATLTVTADAKSKVYGATDPELTVSYSGFANGDDKDDLGGTLAISRASGENVGAYPIMPSGQTSGNYEIYYTGNSLIINKATLTVTADAKSKVYGATDPELTVSYSGFANGDDKDDLGGTLSISRAVGEAVGSYAITPSGQSSGNYDIAYIDNNLTINKATLTVTADAQTKVYGAADPALTVSYSGFVNGENKDHLGGMLSISRASGENVGAYPIMPSGQSSGNYDITYTGNNLTINKATLTVTATGINKVYDGTRAGSVNLSDNRVSGDDITTAYIGAHFNTQHVGMGKELSVTGIYIEGGTDAGNYTVNTTATTTADITAKTLTVTADAKSKTYGEADPVLTYTATGFADGDDESILEGTLSREPGEDAGSYAIRLGSLAAGANYTLSFVGADFTINKAPLAVTADAKSKVYGDTDPVLTYTATGFANGDDNTIVTGSLNRATGEDVGSYAIAQNTLSAGGNYDIAYIGNSLTINKATLTVTATGINKVYDGTRAGSVNLGDNRVSGDDITTAYIGAHFNTQHVGMGKELSVTGIYIEGGTDAGNYTVNTTATTTADITAKTLTVTADTKSKTYGDADPELTYTATGFADIDDGSILEGTLSREPGEDAGTYAIQLGSLSAGPNYTLDFTGADFTITNERVLTITADAKSKTYGEADPVLTYTATGFADGDDESILEGTLSREPGEDAGSYAIRLGSLAAGANYTLSFVGADFTINKATLTVTADAKSKVYGDTDPVLTYVATGFANGDDNTIVTGSLNRATGEDVGDYAIAQNTLSAGGNYTIDYIGNNLTISKAILTVTATGQDKTYDGSRDATVVLQADPINGDAVTVNYTGARFDTRDTGTDKTVEITGISLGGDGAGNYSLSGTTATTTADITAKTLTVTADTKSKTYGEADPVLTYTATGFADGDDESILDGTLSREPGEAAGTYAIRLGSLSAGTNYTLSFTGADFTITNERVLTVTADTKSKTYGEADPELTYTATGFAAGDDESILDGALTREPGEAAGTYAIRLGSLSAGANYTLSFVGADFTIGKKALTVTASAEDKAYDGSRDATVALQGDPINGDAVTVNYTGASFDTKDTGTDKTVEITGISLGGDGAGNYSLSGTTATTTADITAKALAVTASGINKIYDGNTVATVNLGDDHVSGDDITVRYTGAHFNTQHVGMGKALSVTGIYIDGGTDAGNYALSNTTASTTADITAKTLTVTASGTDKIYDGNTVATVNLSDDRVNSDDITTSYTTASFDNKQVGTGKAVSVTGIGISGPDAGNYTVNTTASTTADITAKPLTVTADTKSKTYGEADPELTYTATGFADGDDGSILGGALVREPGEDAGSYAIRLGSLSAGANYTINFTGADFTITNERVLTVTADTKSKTYGDADPELTYTATGFADIDDGSILEGTLSREPGEDAGTYAIQLGSLSAGPNYTLDFTGADFTITNERVLTITADAKSKTYGEADPILTYTATGFADGDDESILEGTLSREPGEAAGSYAIRLGSLSAGANYTLSFVGADFTITNERVLTVTADAKSKTYGDADPELTYTATGFAAGDDESILDGALTREPGEAAGTYAIRLGSLSAGANYTINFTGADFSIIGTDTTDTDGDGVPDYVEAQQGANPNDAGDYLDTDGDGVPDYVEAQQGTNPNDAKDYLDTDGDGVPDDVEVREGTGPTDPGDFRDTDGDGVADYLQARSIREFVSQDLSVAWGTPLDQLVLPAEVVAISSQGGFITMAVSWNLAGYDPLVSGTSAYTGAIGETAGLFNPYDRVPALEITVLPKPAPLDVTLGNSEFTGSPDVFFQEIGAFTVVDPSDDAHGFMLPEGEGDNGYFEVKSGVLFWSSADEAAGRTVFTVVLEVTDRAGNELVKPFTVRRQREPIANLELHNTFTPNGDGMNDMWGIPALRYYSGVRIQVFDNGGQRLFYTEDADVRWDGKHRGKALPVGAYFYVVHVGETGETRRGVLNLLNR